MSAQSQALAVDKPRLQRLWESGPAGWNAALTKPYVMIPFFAVAATAPFVTQYFVDNFGWTGGEFWVRILATCAMYATLALSLNLVVGFAGLLNLGFIAFFGIGSYTYALMESDQLHQHFPFWLALLTLIAVAIAFSLIIGVPSLRLRGDYLAIVTLGFGLVMRELTLDLDRPPILMGHQLGSNGLNITGGTEGIHQVDAFRIPKSLPFLGTAPHSWVYYWIFLGFLGLCVFLLTRWRATRTGRAWIAIRDDELAARAMGVNTFKYRLLAFTASAVIAALVGMINAAWLFNAYPGNYDVQQTVLVFIMVILGGLGSIPGAILGATLVTVLPFLLQQLVFYRYVVFSLILIVIMIFRPEGLLGTVSMRPRKTLGGTVELLTAESTVEASELPAVTDAEAANLEAASGAIVEDPEWKV
ncbi:MAG TPA: branched-chain amino acid ABC transporter permease [Candidatus Dormibacteraeota bacterium]|nr:branched-chain amino acid ABC transporter permease [Candidatus Dormibacteraeota bacterium]